MPDALQSEDESLRDNDEADPSLYDDQWLYDDEEQDDDDDEPCRDHGR